MRRSRSVVLALGLVLLMPWPVAAQGADTSSISGVVVDATGLVVPGANVAVKNKATGVSYETTTTASGAFAVFAMRAGTYTVTVTLDGFKTAILNDVVVNAAVPTTLRATLEPGGLEETIVVEGASPVVQTQASAVATTLTVSQISNLPLTSRATLGIVTTLAGVSTPGGSRQSTVNGLPRSAINITLDGINVQDNTLKSTDGFFAIVNPRLDSVEEVTVSAAAAGAESAGQGAVQVRFVTRSGTNTFAGSAYHYYRNDALNSNTWFNRRDGVAKPELVQNQAGMRAGGPIRIPGLFDGRGRAFFFVNYEEFRQPSDVSRLRTVLSPDAQAGIFRYAGTGGAVQTVNLFDLAARNGQVSTADPVVQKLLADIRAATGTTGTVVDVADPNLQNYRYNVPLRSHNRYPTVRVDVNLTERHRLSSSTNYQRFLTTPDTLNNRDPFFPGFPVTGAQTSERLAVSNSLRSTLGSTMVNEVRIGGSGAPVQFSAALNPSMWSGSLANQNGFNLNVSTAAANITNASSAPTPASRNAYTWLVEDTLNWLKGNHSFNLGGSWTRVNVWLRNQTLLPTVNFGILTSDPADAMFSPTNFPGSSTTNRNDARDLYAVLTGRVSSITSNAGLDEQTGQFTHLGPRLQRGRLEDYGFWAQDSWRIRPNLTVNLGMRYELQMPFHPLNDSYSNATLEDVWGISGLAAGCTDASDVTPANCNVFKPGVTPGKAETQYVPFGGGEHGYNIDWDNFAPSAGAAWTPTAEGGFLRKLLGNSGDSVIRGGFARAYSRPGMSDFTGSYDDNPGILINTDRSESLGNLGPVPLLFRDSSRLGPPDFPQTRNYPLTDVVTGVVTTFDRDIQVPYADSWTVGFQRAVGRDMAAEIRYVGTRGREQWTTYNYNEINIIENGFLDEFRLAQSNLAANIAAGRGNTFRYFGPGTGTAPLPTFLAYFSGVPASQAGNSALYTSTQFTSSTFVNPLARFNPQPNVAANALDSTATNRSNALLAGVPANFLVANPNKLGGAQVVGNGGFTSFHGMQLELRRRMNNGLQFQTSYSYGQARESVFYSFRVPRLDRIDPGSPGNISHAFKANWVYELPLGRGRKFGGNVNSVIDRVIGGWQFSGIATFSTGQTLDFGGVRMVGFNEKDLRGMFQLRKDGNQRVWMLPQDVIDNTVKAFSTSATSVTGYGALGAPEGRYFAPANGPDCIEMIAPDYGSCGARSLTVEGPMIKMVDLSIIKLVPLMGRVRAEFRVELLNAFDFVNYAPVTGFAATQRFSDGSVATRYEVTGLNGDVQSRIMQLVSRISW